MRGPVFGTGRSRFSESRARTSKTGQGFVFHDVSKEAAAAAAAAAATGRGGGGGEGCRRRVQEEGAGGGCRRRVQEEEEEGLFKADAVN